MKTATVAVPQELSLIESPFSPDQIRAIRAKTPASAIKKVKYRGDREVSYVPSAIVIRKLNHVFGYGGWSFQVVKSDLIEDHAVVQGRLSVHIKGRDVVVDQFGGHPIAREKVSKKPVDVGDTLKSASSDCLKKCASMLGLFSDVYGGDFFVDITQSNINKPSASKEDKAVVDAARLAMRAAATEAGMTLQELSKLVRTRTGKSITAITQAEAQSIEKFVSRSAEAKKLAEKPKR